MDPVSIVGLVGSTASLALSTARVANDIRNILKKYENAETILRDMEKECKMLEIAFKRIQDWLHNIEYEFAESRDVIFDLGTCLADFQESLDAIQKELSKALNTPTARFGARRKMKFVWNEDGIQALLIRVQNKRTVLGFVLQAFNMSPIDSRRQIYQAARATSIQLDRHRDERSIQSRESAGFETVLANSSPYLRARYAPSRSVRAITETDDDLKDNLSRLAIGDTLVATTDYEGTTSGDLQISEGDFVKILKKTRGLFWVGEVNGKTGRFPIKCCDTELPLIGGDTFGAATDTIDQNAVPTISDSWSDDLENSQAAINTKSASGKKPSSAFSLFMLWSGISLMVLLAALIAGGAFRPMSEFRVPTLATEEITPQSPSTASLSSQFSESIGPVTDSGVISSTKSSKSAVSVSTSTIKPLAKRTTSPSTQAIYNEALLDAAASGSNEKVLKLLKLGAKPNVCGPMLLTPLHHAAANGHVEIIESLLKYKTGCWYADNGTTPLHLAAMNGHTEAVKVITKIPGHDWNRERATCPQAVQKIQASTGNKFDLKFEAFFARKTFTARELAVIFGHADTVRAFPSGSNNNFRNALSCACMLGDINMVETLWEYHEDRSWWEKLFKMGKPLYSPVRWFPAPPLHLAVMSGNQATVAFLLERGFSANDQTSRSIMGWFTNAFSPYSLPAHYAAIVGSTDLLLALERRTKDLVALDHLGRTPLSYAAEYLHEAAVELLVERKYPEKRAGWFRKRAGWFRIGPHEVYLGYGHKWKNKGLKAIPNQRIINALKKLGIE